MITDLIHHYEKRALTSHPSQQIIRAMLAQTYIILFSQYVSFHQLYLC